MYNSIKSAPNAHKSAIWIMVIGIIIVAAGLRAPLTSVGPLIGLMREDIYISNTWAGMLTTLPLLAFALFSPVVPKLARRFGAEATILVSIIFLTIGIVLRSLSGVAALYIGTAVIGLAIAVSNVLLPSLIKRDFPGQIGLMTGVYTISMNLLGAAASGISVPLAVGFGFGWQGALGIWSILSFVAIFAWLLQVKGYSGKKDPVVQHDNDDNRSLWRSVLAWQISLFMGLQSTVFFVSITWLPEILKQQGMSPEQSGWLLSVMQLALLPCTFVVPIIAGRMKSQSSLIAIMASLLLTAMLGLLHGSSGLAVLWMIALGSGIGFAFSLAMVF